MSRKDYILIAHILNKWVRDPSLRAVLFVEFGLEFKRQYPTFDSNKWHSALKRDK